MRLHSGLLAIAVLAALFPKGAEASSVIFTDRALFELITGPHDIERFDREPVYNLDYINDSCTAYLHDFSISADCHGFGGVYEGAAFLPNSWPNSVTFDQPRTAVGFDYRVEGLFSNGDGVMAFSFGSVEFFLTGSGFLGMLDTTGIYGMGTSRIYNPNENPVFCCSVSIDNLLMTRVPEPSTLLLFGSAFALLHGVRRRTSAPDAE
jgi:hypothetical protein